MVSAMTTADNIVRTRMLVGQFRHRADRVDTSWGRGWPARAIKLGRKFSYFIPLISSPFGPDYGCHVDDDLSCSCAVIVHGRKFWLLKTTVDNVITVSRLNSLFPLLRSGSGFKSSITVGTSILLRISTYAIGGAGSFFRKKDFLRRFWTTRILKLRLLFVHLSRNKNRGSEKLLIALFPVSGFSVIQSYIC